MPQSSEQRRKWTPPAPAKPSADLPQIVVGGEKGVMHRLKRDPMKRYGSQDDWNEFGKAKAFGAPPISRST